VDAEPREVSRRLEPGLAFYAVFIAIGIVQRSSPLSATWRSRWR
jgi:hypothetical protein